ncbi:MAG: hypothetical protein ACI8RD_007573, partial [Bacillariaceae sp.]
TEDDKSVRLQNLEASFFSFLFFAFQSVIIRN